MPQMSQMPQLSQMSMYTFIMHVNSFWLVQCSSMCKHAYLVEIFIILLSGQFFSGSACGEKQQLSTLMLNLHGNCFFRNRFSGCLRGVSIHSAAGRQSSIPELVRDVKMLKTHFYNLLPMSPTETLSTQ